MDTPYTNAGRTVMKACFPAFYGVGRAPEDGQGYTKPRKFKSAMTIKQAVRIADGKLVVKNKTILTNVPENVVPTSASTTGPVDGVFLGAVFDQDSSRHVVSLGAFRDVRFLACFRFKLWWMAQKMGDKGRDIPMETQFLLVETKEGSHIIDNDNKNSNIVYTVFLPLIEGPFKACLQGNDRDELELCLESGDIDATASIFTHLVYISSGIDPFLTIHEAIKAVKLHLGSFKLREEKKLPGIVDYFGWCTWDAFYQEVTQEGVEAGLESLKSGGTPPKFVIIDDGWQSVASDNDRETEQELGQPRLLRLTGIKENEKFQKPSNPSKGIENIVSVAKEKYGLKYVYVWHAITGYWGGVRPGVKEMKHYESAMQYPKLCDGVMENEPGWKTDAIALQGLGLVNPRSVYKFFFELHSYLTSAGVDGVKVDAQCILETLGAGFGGRVEITSQYHQALDASVARHFPDNGCIACMSHNLESLYCSKQTAIVRASDDFFPREPVSHTIHIAAVAYNSVFLGEVMLPDWDMFHSLHPAAEYHGSARAISGGPVYVSDAPGKHDFNLLKKLVLPDGSILRARLPGRPTKDCLFADPSRDGISLLKIWNMNKHTGVLGAYNCQGAAWNSAERKNTFHSTNTEPITGHISGGDVHLLSDVAPDSNWDGNVALYSHNGATLAVVSSNVSLPVSLKVLEHEVYTITPVKTFSDGIKFAPLGLIDMFNSGGAIDGLEYDWKVDGTAVVSVDVKGCGRFGAYSSTKPRKCTVGSSSTSPSPVGFEYEAATGLVTVKLEEMPPEEQKVHKLVFEL
ncbi:probable galactinol--sucrose galactosyltransferase 6 isoform X2 [Andrographis paniculata]|uniref:probable galactinol--sucrose galactosyltransferase 6 isoform X2 n=1 Tax=Andrographis paniculata TaxID=175694 RepID=UPI0021E7BC28|nr:probable galactinol--sucrose galactosyltransferase 6 isoform X2 [Andrographis paniculata]